MIFGGMIFQKFLVVDISAYIISGRRINYNSYSILAGKIKKAFCILLFTYVFYYC